MTDKNKTPYSIEEMLAVDTLTARYMGGYNNGLEDALTIAAEYERVKRERDELEQLHEMLADERTENIKQFALIEQLRKERDYLAISLIRYDEVVQEVPELTMTHNKSMVTAIQLAKKAVKKNGNT